MTVSTSDNYNIRIRRNLEVSNSASDVFNDDMICIRQPFLVCVFWSIVNNSNIKTQEASQMG